MKRLVLAIALAFLVLGADQQGATADSAPANPQQQLALIQQIRAQLSSNLADALAAQQQLRQSLQSNSAQQQVVQGKISDIEAKIADLDDQIAAAQRREAILAQRIDTERAQIRQLARSVYESPGSVLLVLAQSHSLSDLFTRVADMNVAGSRAADLKASLAGDLAQLQQERAAEQSARDEQVVQRNELDGSTPSLAVPKARCAMPSPPLTSLSVFAAKKSKSRMFSPCSV